METMLRNITLLIKERQVIMNDKYKKIGKIVEQLDL
jgi:hypothetical protein